MSEIHPPTRRNTLGTIEVRGGGPTTGLDSAMRARDSRVAVYDPSSGTHDLGRVLRGLAARRSPRVTLEPSIPQAHATMNAMLRAGRGHDEAA
jgi:hypothetical protein